MFAKYKNITEKIIEELKANNDINTLMEDRAQIIKEIESLNQSKEKVLEEYNKLNIKELDDNLGELLKVKMCEIRVEIADSKVRRSAYSSYTSNNRRENFFARKV